MSKNSLTTLNHAFSKHKKVVNSKCDVCSKKISTSGYICLGCSMISHKRCVVEILEECSKNSPKLSSSKKEKSSHSKRFDLNMTNELEGEEVELGKSSKVEINRKLSHAMAKKEFAKEKSTSISRIDYKQEARAPILPTIVHNNNHVANGNNTAVTSNHNLPVERSISSNSPFYEEKQESELQVMLENALMDAFRLQTRVKLSEKDCSGLLKECECLWKQKTILNQKKIQLQNKISQLSADVKAANKKREESSMSLRNESKRFINVMSGASQILCSSQVAQLEEVYQILVKQEDIRIPFLNKPKNTSSLVGHINIHDETLIQRIASFRTVIRRLEYTLRLKESLRSEIEFLEKDFKILQDSITSLQNLYNAMSESHRHTTSIAEKMSHNSKTLSSVDDALLQLQTLFEQQPVIVGGEVNPTVNNLLNIIETEAAALVESPDKSPEFDPWNTGGMDDKNQILFTNNNDSQFPEINAATIPKLVELLTYENYHDTTYPKAFLLTYRSFMTPTELLERIILRYCLSPPESVPVSDIVHLKENRQVPIRIRALKVIKYWIENFYSIDFKDVNINQILTDFLENTVARTGHATIAENLLSLLKKKWSNLQEPPQIVIKKQQPPEPYIPRALTLFHIHPVEIARQLTLIDERNYSKLEATEFLKCGWSKPDKELRAPNICRMTVRFNQVSNWVVHEIITKDSLSDRVQTIIKFITIAGQLDSMNNFASLFAIVAGLTSIPIHRMRKSWEGVGKENYLIFSSFQKLVDQSFKEYRQRLKTTKLPCIPYLGLWQTDLTFLSDGNPDRVEGGLINFKKMKKVADTILSVKQYQNEQYCFEPLDQVQQYLLNIPDIIEDEAYEKSLMIEPRSLAATAQCDWIEI